MMRVIAESFWGYILRIPDGIEFILILFLGKELYQRLKRIINSSLDYIQTNLVKVLFFILATWIAFGFLFGFLLTFLNSLTTNNEPMTCPNIDETRFIDHSFVNHLQDSLAREHNISLTFQEFLTYSSSQTSSSSSTGPYPNSFWSSLWNNIWKSLGISLIAYDFLILAPFNVVQPVIAMLSLISLYAIQYRKNQRYAQNEYPNLVIIGWNVFKKDSETGKLELSLPTEKTLHISEVFPEAEALQEKVLDLIMNPPSSPSPPVVAAPGGGPTAPTPPDFYLILPDNRDFEELHRFISNQISNCLSSSQWSDFALHYKNKDRHELNDAIYLITYERNAPVKAIRVWIMFASELLAIKDYSLTDDASVDEYFKLPNPRWKLRVQNLQKWAKFEFDGSSGKRKIHPNAMRYTRDIYLPLFWNQTLTVSVEWNIFDMTRQYFMTGIEKQCLLEEFVLNNEQLKHYFLDKANSILSEDTKSSLSSLEKLRNRIVTAPHTLENLFLKRLNDFFSEWVKSNWVKLAIEKKTSSTTPTSPNPVHEVHYLVTYEKDAANQPSLEILFLFPEEFTMLENTSVEELKRRYPKNNCYDYDGRLQKLKDWAKLRHDKRITDHSFLLPY